MRIRLTLVLACFVLFGPAAVRADSDSSAAARAAGELLRAPALRGARVGVSVVELATGRAIYDHEATRALVPASNQKLIVASAVLAQWGPSHRFETPVLIDAPLDERGVVDGALWVVGRGDPSLVSESMWKLAEDIRLAGVTEIRNGIGVDASYFDAAGLHPDWRPTTRRAYEAPTSAFAANYSSFRIELTAGPRTGSPARLAVAPAIPYFRPQSKAITVPNGRELNLGLDPLPDGTGERVRVTGSFPAGADPITYWRSVALPERYAASLLRSQLESHGVRVAGPIRFGAAPQDATELLRFEGETVGNIVGLLNKWSNNFVAEQLTKLLGAERFGAPGTWDKGARALKEHLSKIGVDPLQTVIVDGSGLSARNRISAQALVGVLRAGVQAPASGPELLASLPLGGRDGTLEDRMEELAHTVRGKTGHLSHVSTLTGLLPGPNGQSVAFSVLINGARGGRLDVDAALDAFVTRLALEQRAQRSAEN